MKPRYNPKDIEKNIQQHWIENKTFQAKVDHNKEKFYCLSMLPYPSGKLHMGHVRNYTIGDAISRFQRLNGKNVLQPVGWDAFGLPAENAALKHNTAPALWTEQNIAYMKSQLQMFGFSYDWDREVTTCKPEYYKWEQEFFIDLYNKGLVYRKKSTVNWCPQDNTVLANEQVIDGRCWRCDSKVEQRDIPQWFLKIREYADELLSKLDDLPFWPENVKSMQRHWIGKSTGANVRFKLVNSPDQYVEVYTTRPDTLYGVSCLALASKHPLLSGATGELKEFLDECSQIKVAESEIATIEKKGYKTDLFAINPLTGEEIPVYVANFIINGYGTGAIMCTPAHDVRDYEFAIKYNLPIKKVVECDALPFTEKGVVINSGEFTGLTSAEAKQQVIARLGELKAGEEAINFRIRDWSISRQRYWGTPIPMLQDAEGNLEPVAKTDLPVELPLDVVMNSSISPLKQDKAWSTVHHNGKEMQRDTDTFDTFMESSWYYARYTSPKYSLGMLDKEEANYWLPIDQYIGGIEHAILHLLYFRFFHKLMRDAGLLTSDEPAIDLLCQGMVLSEAFYYTNEQGLKVWLNQDEVINNNGKLTDEFGHEVVSAGMTKMSKSKNNGVDPQSMVEKYGADTIRLFVLFAAPPASTLEWQETGVDGAYRFLNKVWNLVAEFKKLQNTDGVESLADKNLRRELHKTIAKVTDDIKRRKSFNTAIAAIMEFINKLAKVDFHKHFALFEESLKAILVMLNPMVPHITSALLQEINQEDIDLAAWPTVDEGALVNDEMLIVVQVNGKLRDKVTLSATLQQDEILSLVKDLPKIQKLIDGKTLVKEIYVPNKLVSLIIK